MYNLVKYNFVEAHLRDFSAKRPDLEDISDRLDVIQSLIEDLPDEERHEIARMQGFLIDKFSDYQPVSISFRFESQKSTWQTVRDLMDRGQKRGSESFVALHLVGATLQRRFPALDISHQSYSTEMQEGRPGDFRVGDTVFHVTVAPMSAVYDKCKKNLERGLKPYLLVPDRLVAGTKH